MDRMVPAVPEEAVSCVRRAYDGGDRFSKRSISTRCSTLCATSDFERIMTQMRADVDRMREEVLAMEAELEAARAAAGR